MTRESVPESITREAWRTLKARLAAESSSPIARARSEEFLALLREYGFEPEKILYDGLRLRRDGVEVTLVVLDANGRAERDANDENRFATRAVLVPVES